MPEQSKPRLQPTEELKAEFLPTNDEVEIDLVELAYRLLDKWKMIVCFILVFAALFGLYTFYFVTPMYEATSTLYVLGRTDSAVNIADLQIGAALTADYVKVFDIWEVHEKVIATLNLPYTYDEMEKMLQVTNEANTRMLDITITSPSASEAAAVANQYAIVASEFIEETMSTDRPNMMSAARVPVNPVSPNMAMIALVGALVGCMLSMGMVVLQTLMDNKYKTAEDIRKYSGLPTLAVVPVEDSLRSAKKGGRKL